jgi:L-threonylcarbamoyladenylate synthase
VSRRCDDPVADTPPEVLATSDPDALQHARLALVAGGIVGIPTETVYGLAVLPRPVALEALIVAKRRPQEKGIALLIDDLAQVADLVVISDAVRRIADALWPGPLTLVLPIAPSVMLPAGLTGGRDTLALRMPDHPVPRALARDLGPIGASSANRSGEPDATTAAELIRTVGESLSLVLDDGPVRGGKPSSVVAIDVSGVISVLRAGTYDRHDIEAAMEPDR